VEWLTWIGIACAWVAIAVNVMLARRAQRRFRQADALNELLQHIVLDSYVAQHRGTHEAWAKTMGNIQVTVTAIPRMERSDD
jgi:hypothetical protein